MALWLRKGAVVMALAGWSTVAAGEPAHVLLHVSKRVAYPVRHPLKSSRSVWKFLAEVF